MDKMQEAVKIINSCVTYEQLEACEKWVAKLKGFNKPNSTDFIIQSELRCFIIDKQIKLLKERNK